MPSSIRPVELEKNIHYGPSTERLALSRPLAPLWFWGETDTGNYYIATPDEAWLGPYTAADLGLGGGAGGSGASSGSGLPAGVLARQATITASTTEATMTFSLPAKGIKITLFDERLSALTAGSGNANVADGHFVVCFDPPAAGSPDPIRDDWLNETLIGPSAPVIKGQPFEMAFKNPDGTQALVSRMGFKASVTDALLKASVVIIV